jgi:hypothetical protein
MRDGWLQAQRQGQTDSVDGGWRGVPEGEAGVSQGSRGHANTQGRGKPADESERPVPIESEEERAAREADEMAALDAVGDYEADPNVMLEDVPQDIVIKTLKVSCACVPVLVFARMCVRARDVDMCS